jgi:HAD superfamily hydrolase (TIGR01549 family)
MKRYTLIIFDLDDTLFDYSETERQAVTEACGSFGVASTNDLYLKYRLANDDLRREYRDLNADTIQRFRIARAAHFLALIGRGDISPEDFVQRYLQHSTSGVLISGVQETLEALSGIRKVVATNGTTYPRLNKLRSSVIAKYFDGFFSSETLGLAKSSADFFLRVLQHYNTPKDEVLVVGDDYRLDVLCAAASGLDCCWFNYRKEPITRPLPATVLVLDTFSDLVRVVRGASHV